MRKRLRLIHAAQRRFVGWFGVASLLGGGLAVGMFNILARRKLDTVLYAMRLPQASPGDLLITEMLVADLAALVFIAAVFAWAAHRLLASIDRPLSGLTGEIRMVVAGNLRPDRVAVPANMVGGELAAELDDLREELRRRFLCLQDGSAALRRLEAADLSELPRVREKLAREIEEMKAAVNDLKL